MTSTVNTDRRRWASLTCGLLLLGAAVAARADHTRDAQRRLIAGIGLSAGRAALAINGQHVVVEAPGLVGGPDVTANAGFGVSAYAQPRPARRTLGLSDTNAFMLAFPVPHAVPEGGFRSNLRVAVNGAEIVNQPVPTHPARRALLAAQLAAGLTRAGVPTSAQVRTAYSSGGKSWTRDVLHMKEPSPRPGRLPSSPTTRDRPRGGLR